MRMSLRSLSGVLGATVALCAAANEPALTVTAGGRTATYAPAALLALPVATIVNVPDDVAYRRAMTYRAIPVAALLAGVAVNETIRFVA